MLELGLRLRKLGTQGVNHVGLFGTRGGVLEPWGRSSRVRAARYVRRGAGLGRTRRGAGPEGAPGRAGGPGRAGAPRGEPAARCATADRQALINPCGLKTNFFATPLSKSL